jgi:hypothetical protein
VNNTLTNPAGRPKDLPIWARLNLASQDVSFGEVLTWNRETETRIIAFLDNGRYIYLYKR